jgi:glycosyltransferase involved in cell wall biosynthesis
VILQSSRLEEWKGQAILIAALGRMKELPGWEAWIAGGVQKSGESDYLSALRRRVEELGISERVRFLGQRSDVRQLMAAADVYCQPNTGPEPFGLAFVEALQAGLPVVTSGFGGAAEIVDATCGILTRPADIAAVSTALVELIASGTGLEGTRAGRRTVRSPSPIGKTRSRSSRCERVHRPRQTGSPGLTKVDQDCWWRLDGNQSVY